MSIAEKSTTIAENEQKVYAAGKASMVDKSKLIPKTVSGSYISVDDVSEIPHSVGCKVESVNLCPEEVESGYYYDASGTDAAPTASFIRIFPIKVSPLTTYTLSTNLIIYTIWYFNADGAIKRESRTGLKTWVFTTPDNCNEIRISLRNTSGAADTVAFEYAMLNKGTTALPYTPYVKSEEVKVTRCGENMLPYPYHHGSTTAAGLSFVDNNGIVTINGTAERDILYYFTSPLAVEKNPYTLPFSASATLSIKNEQSGVAVGVSLYNENGESLFSGAGGKSVSFNANSEKTKLFSYVQIKSGTALTDFVIKPMLNIGTTALPYEPYNGQTLTPTTDGTVEGMTSVSPYMNIFADTEGVNIEATYNMSWGMQEERKRFYNDFRQGKINVSISFEWLALDKASTTSVVNALSSTATGQTATFNKTAKEAAFTDTEWSELIATKSNWTISLL